MGLNVILKQMVNIFCVILVSPFILFFMLFNNIFSKDGLFWSISQFLSLVPGKTGSYLRKNFYKFSMTHCHDDCAIMFGTIFSQRDTEIGQNVYIGPNCNIGSCKIEDHCTLGSNVHIMSGKNQHNFDLLDVPVKDQGGTFDKVIIGEDTWIGNGALVMANIGKKCIIGAGSVVVHDIESYSIVAGNPARVLKKRDKNE